MRRVIDSEHLQEDGKEATVAVNLNQLSLFISEVGNRVLLEQCVDYAQMDVMLQITSRNLESRP